MSSRAKGYAPRVSEPRREGAHVVEMQRRRLLLAIGEVVAENGLEAATVGRICEQAGVSRRTFYELFEDRETCLLAAFDQAIERIAQKIAPAYVPTLRGEGYSKGHAVGAVGRQGGRWRKRLRVALSALLELFDAEPNLARLCIVEAPRAGPELLERRRHVLEALAAAVDEGRTEARAGCEPPPLTAQGVVGGALSVIHARLLTRSAMGEAASGEAPPALVELTAPLMAMIVHPYLGAAAARRELERPAPNVPRELPRSSADPFKGLPIRFTYRTARVLSTIASSPGASNRHIADYSGIADEGQMSRLLRRLHQFELIENRGEGQAKGEPNAWTLTRRGEAIHAAIAVQATAG
ncbi:MAG: TetR/AcrR family transcriptional regulator [Solirubrobacteraceae bacterium]